VDAFLAKGGVEPRPLTETTCNKVVTTIRSDISESAARDCPEGDFGDRASNLFKCVSHIVARGQGLGQGRLVSCATCGGGRF
jgi:hypothetical protein